MEPSLDRSTNPPPRGPHPSWDEFSGDVINWGVGAVGVFVGMIVAGTFMSGEGTTAESSSSAIDLVIFYVSLFALALPALVVGYVAALILATPAIARRIRFDLYEILSWAGTNLAILIVAAATPPAIWAVGGEDLLRLATILICGALIVDAVGDVARRRLGRAKPRSHPL